MIIDKATIETTFTSWLRQCTAYEYPESDADNYSGERVYFIKLSIPVPGGEVNYRIKTTKEINDSIEKAQQLR